MRRTWSSSSFWLLLSCIPLLAVSVVLWKYRDPILWGDWVYSFPYLWKDHYALSDIVLYQIGEHRPIVVNAVYVALIRFGALYPTVQWLTLTMNVVTTGLLIALLRRSLPQTSRRLGPMAFVFAVLLFSFLHWMTFSMGMLALTLVFAWVTAAGLLLCVDHPSRVRIMAAAVCCAAASFTFTNGLLSWIVFAPLVARSRSRHILFFWVFCAIACVAFYLHDYHAPHWTPGITAGITHPLLLIQYALILSGRELAPFSAPAALVAGILLWATMCSVILRHCRSLWRERRAWLCLFAFAALSIVAVSVGRVGTVGSFLLPHYSMFSVFFLCVSLGILTVTVRRWYGLGAVCVLVVLVHVHAISRIVTQDWHTRWMQLQQGKACMEIAENASSYCLEKLVWNGDAAFARAQAPGFLHFGIVEAFVLPDNVQMLPPDPAFGSIDAFQIITDHRYDSGTSLLVSGSVQSDEALPEILLTIGKDQRLIGRTVAFPVRSHNGLLQVWNVPIDLPEGQRAVDLHAWLYDDDRNLLRELPRSEQER